MTTVAVTGASSALGHAVLAHLDDDDRVDRLVGLDVTSPEMPPAKLDFRTADIRDRVLDQALSGVDVVVQCPAVSSLLPASGRGWVTAPDEETAFAEMVEGTRNLLEAAGRVGVAKLVHLSSTTVYGAHPDNPMPLEEQAPLRANPDFPFAYYRLLAEELVTAWAEHHPEATVSVLRVAPMLDSAVDDVAAHAFEAPRLPRIGEYAPPHQFAHREDVAGAVGVALRTDLAGAYNVAADGWLSSGEVSAVLGRKAVSVPETVGHAAVAQLHRLGLAVLPPGALHYLMHPVVVTTDRMHAHGWAPAYGNRDVLREFARTHARFVTLGRLRLRRRDFVVGACAGAGVVAAAAVLGWRAVRRPG